MCPVSTRDLHLSMPAFAHIIYTLMSLHSSGCFIRLEGLYSSIYGLIRALTTLITIGVKICKSIVIVIICRIAY